MSVKWFALQLLLFFAGVLTVWVIKAHAQEITPDATCPDLAPALTGDQQITAFDLSAVGGVIGQAVPPAPAVDDLYPDGAITAADLSVVAGNVGKACLPEEHSAIVATEQSAGDSLLSWACNIRVANHVYGKTQATAEVAWIGEVNCTSYPSNNLVVHCRAERHLAGYDLVVEEYGGDVTTAPSQPADCPSLADHTLIWRYYSYNIKVCYEMVSYATGETVVPYHCIKGPDYYVR
jgi:hypothetical protein